MSRCAALFLGLLLCACAWPASDETYRRLIAQPSQSRLRSILHDVGEMGSRLTGSPGEQAAFRYAEARFQSLGLKTLREPFNVTVPSGQAGELRIGEQRHALLPLWPNLVQTSTCDVTGPMVYGGDGSLEALSHKTIKGSIVFLDFNCGPRWTNAAMLGAAAVVFIQPRAMSRDEAEAKFRATPLNVPRFLIKAMPPLSAAGRIVCRQDWMELSSANLIAELPGTDPKLSNEPMVIWAYADAMSVAPGAAPGAEQSSGLAALLELAEVLGQGEHRRPVQFVVSGGHCLGLQGAREFVERRFESQGVTPLLVVTLDLSTASKTLGVFGRGYGYLYRDQILDSVLPVCRVLRHHAERLTPILGESLPRVVLTDGANHSDNRTWRNNIPAKFAFDCEPFMSAGYAAITFATTDDARLRVDTPDDTFERLNIENLHRQVQTISVMLHHIANDPIEQTGDDVLPLHPSNPKRISLIGGFATATGYVAVYDPTRSLVPDVRVTGSLAVRVTGKKSMMGVRGNEVQLVRGPEAEYKFIGLPPLTDYATLLKPDTVIIAYHLDSKSGRIDYAADDGPFGYGAFPTSTGLKTSFRSSPIVVFSCVPIDLYGLIDPQDLTPFFDETILDPVGGATPRSFGFVRSYFDQTNLTEVDDTAVLFLQPGQRFQLLMGSNVGENRLILTGSSPRNTAGEGYATARNVALATAKDICAINQGRIEEFARYRILGVSAVDLQTKAKAEIQQAEVAEAAQDYAGAQRHATAAWGLALRAHPVLQHTSDDIVNGVIFYSFLLIPFSFFFERLVFASRSLTKQVALTLATFVAAFLILRVIHPAFEIVSNPAMIFVGFVMGALSLIVATFIFGKFETALRSVKQAQSGVRELDVRRSNVAMAAFSLGISNLRRRKARTILTTLTLVVMTFIVLSFTSIVPELQLNQTPSANPARYSGLLLRDPALAALQASSYDALSNEFAGRAAVCRRVFSFGENIPQNGGIAIQRGDQWADANAIEGLDPGEALLSRPQEALLPGGRWFKEGELDAIILPQPIAEKLNVAAGQKVRFMGSDFTVAGIFDPDAMKSVVDLDGETLMPPNFDLSKQDQKITRSQTRAFRKFIRLDSSGCLFLPAQTALALGGDLRSIAVGFSDPRETPKAMASLMPRLRLNLYASVPSGNKLQVRQFSILQGSKSSGLALVLIQLAIAAVFVLNTMIASVFERTREISIFSAIGLAPSHIATLFFAESLVYGVLGAVFGYFSAQGVAKIIVSTGAYPELTINFSSTSAIMSAMLVIGVVIASTIYPARKAAQIAAPAMAEEALASEPEGDEWTLPLPFSVSAADAGPLVAFLADWLKAYEEYTIGSFVTSGTSLNPSGESFSVTSTAWLAPYDLGVSQELRIDATPSPVQGIYTLSMTLRRLAGEPKNWETLNRRFLTSLRQQFLAWRTLSEIERARFTGDPAVAT